VRHAAHEGGHTFDARDLDGCAFFDRVVVGGACAPVLGADADLTAEAVDELVVAIHQWTGNNAHIVERRPDELAEMIAADDPLVASWRADHIDLVGARLLHLLRDVRRAS